MPIHDCCNSYLVARTPPGTSSGASARTSTRAAFLISSWTPVVSHKNTEMIVLKQYKIPSWRCTTATTPTSASAPTTTS